MLGSLLVTQVEHICHSLASGKRVTFDPRPILKALGQTPQLKMKQQRNINMFLNSAKYKNLMKQLQKEFDIALIKQ